MIGDRLRTLREAKRLTLEHIAERTGLLRTYILAIENGDAMTSIDIVERLARALQVQMYELFYSGRNNPVLINLPNRLTCDDIVNRSFFSPAESFHFSCKNKE